jgi:FMN phosphatase YigB (HAD superfamily)
VKDGNGIRLVCFDLGGVLVRICHGWRNACAAAGLDVRSREGLDVDAVWRQVAHEHELGVLTKARWAETLSASLHDLYSGDELCKIHDAILGGEYDDVGSIVDRLHRAGVMTACLSNTNEDHWSRMLRRGAHASGVKTDYPAVRRLEQRFASHLLGFAKPDEAIFRAVETVTGRRPNEILFFDDGPKNVEAARRMRWNAELIDPAAETAPQILAHLEQYRLVPRPAR